MRKLTSLGNIELNQHEFRLLIDSLSDGVVLTDAAGIILMVNHNWEKISGIKGGEVENRNVRILVRKGYYSHSVVSKHYEEQSAASIVRFNNGAEALITAIPVRGDDGIKLVICSVKDLIEIEANYKAWEESQYLKASLPKELKKFSEVVPELNNIVAHSPAMRSLLRSLFQVAKVDSTVLFTGNLGQKPLCPFTTFYELTVDMDVP